MTHIITSLCVRDNSCMDVCPVECINEAALHGHYEHTNHHQEKVVLETTRPPNPGDVVDLRASIQANYDFYKQN